MEFLAPVFVFVAFVIVAHNVFSFFGNVGRIADALESMAYESEDTDSEG